MNIEQIATAMMADMYNVQDYDSATAWNKIKDYMEDGESTSFVHPILGPLSSSGGYVANTMRGYTNLLRIFADSFPDMQMDIQSTATTNSTNDVHLDFILTATFTGVNSPITGVAANSVKASQHSMWRIVFNQNKKIIEVIKGYDTAGWNKDLGVNWF